MNYYQYILYILLISILCGEKQTAEEILLKSFHRMEGIDYRFMVDSKESGKKKKEKHFLVSVHWPSDGEFLCQTRITSILTKRKKPSSFWENRYKDGTKAKKWLSLPITGKIKDVTNKKSGKIFFSFSDLVVNEADIRLNSKKLLPPEKIDTFSVYVIESIEKSKSGKIKESKKLWIEAESYMPLKVEFYTGNKRLYRSVECSNFHYMDTILFPMNIYVRDFKSKRDIQITIKEVELNPKFELDIFIPKDQ